MTIFGCYLFISNSLADSLATIVGTIIRELYLIGAQLINVVAVILLHFLQAPESGEPNSPNVRSIDLECLSVDSEAEDQADDVQIFLRSMATQKGRSVFRILWRLGWGLSKVLIFPKALPTDPRMVYMTSGDKITTGCFEDVYAAILAFVDHWRIGMRNYLFRCHPILYCKHMWAGLALLSPSRIFRADLLDTRTPKDFIIGQGYPYEDGQVVTKDGYVLHVDRIPRPTSTSALYFQHGIMDSSYGWVCCGSVQSAAFLGYDRGHDIYLGNMRGNGQSYNKPPGMPYNQYWNFTFDDMGMYDVAAFVDYISQKKEAELGPDTPFTITIIAHSLGAAAALVYLVHAGMQGEPHRVKQAILMSPAGYHCTIPTFCRVVGWPLFWLVRFIKRTHLGPYAIKVTSAWVKVFLAKLFRDIHGHPATRTLFCTALARYLIGGHPSDFPLQHVHSLFFNVLQAGIAINLHEQYWKIYQRDRFESFDYGKEKNQWRYGQPGPILYMKHYDKIDCSVHFVAGLRDSLIPPINVLKHYDALKVHNRATTFKAVDAGHADLTMAITEETLSYIMGIVGSVSLAECSTPYSQAHGRGFE